MERGSTLRQLAMQVDAGYVLPKIPAHLYEPLYTHESLQGFGPTITGYEFKDFEHVSARFELRPEPEATSMVTIENPTEPKEVKKGGLFDWMCCF